MKGIKKFFVLLLILVITLPGETAHAFSFVPAFISHYQHHNQEHHRLSLIDFIREHFGETNHENTKHHKQDDCPTNHDHALVTFTFVLQKKVKFETVSENNFDFEKKALLPPYLFGFSEFHSSIWQPPKID